MGRFGQSMVAYAQLKMAEIVGKGIYIYISELNIRHQPNSGIYVACC